MTLKYLDDPRAVRAALDEFDQLGRDAFLKKYGFGHAREYFITVHGRLHDSKAIAGAAHGFPFPSEGPLKSSEFSGGEATVKQTLSRLGFEVRVLKERATSRT